MAGNVFTDWLRSLGWVQKGDCLYVVSDMLELAKTEKAAGRKLDLNEVIDGIMEMTGPEGTILYPTFNWDFCQGVPFDYYKTRSKTGALTKAALQRDDYSRTAHPLYSFAVWGKKKQELMENDCIHSFGVGTIFEKMYEWDAKVLAIGLGALAGTTYVHHVEQMVGVPYRYDKAFTADYTDAAGHCEKRTYHMYVRDLVKDPQYLPGFEPLAQEMERLGLIQTRMYGTTQCHFMTVRELDEATRREILENDSRRMYRYHGQRED